MDSEEERERERVGETRRDETRTVLALSARNFRRSFFPRRRDTRP